MIAIPETAAAREATDHATAHLSPAFVGHSIRAYQLAAAAGDALGVHYDAETLYVAAILHDAGFAGEPEPDRSFEVVGAEIARTLAERHALPSARRIWDAIVYHTVPHAARAAGEEALLVHLGSGADIFGLQVPIEPTTLAEISAAYPRGSLAHEFAQITERHAAIHPYGQLAAFRALGITAR